MVNSKVFLFDLKFGRCSSTTEECQALCELMSVDMLLLDSKATIMLATVNVNRVPTRLTLTPNQSSLFGDKYWVYMAVSDASESSLLVAFDAEMNKLTNVPASGVSKAMGGDDNTGSDVPGAGAVYRDTSEGL
ncbi:hypothetical protein Rs2_15594 [Raphanus sativus]|nr:hypothetical protein Rs2_15594 [Raphanus sativus]